MDEREVLHSIIYTTDFRKHQMFPHFLYQTSHVALIHYLEQSAFKNHAFEIKFWYSQILDYQETLIFIVNLGWSGPHSCIKKRDDPQLYWVDWKNCIPLKPIDNNFSMHFMVTNYMSQLMIFILRLYCIKIISIIEIINNEIWLLISL